MTNPNGEYDENTNPDHKRHYPRRALEALLSERFPEVEAEFAVADGKLRRRGLKGWSARHPLLTAASMIGNLIATYQSSRPGVAERADGTRHLVAVVRKSR